MRLISCLKFTVLSLVFMQGMHAQTIWDGDQGDNLWTNPSNWDNGVPIAGQTATINNAIPSQLTGANGFASDLTVGGTNSNLLINSGSVLTLTGATNLGSGAGNVGTITATGTGTQWISPFLTVGNIGTGVINLSGGATFTTNGGIVSKNIGLSAGVGTLTASNPNTLWTSTGSTTNIGNGSTGTVTIQSGAGANFSFLSTGLNGGTGNLNVTGLGTLVTAVNKTIGFGANATGIVTIEDGAQLTVTGPIQIAPMSTSTGTLNLNGTPGSQGRVITNMIQGGSGGVSVLFDGGILQARISTPLFITSVGNLQALSGGAFIDSQNFNITINSPFIGSGVVTKQGSGILTLAATAPLNNAGGLVVDNGTVNSTSSLASIAGPVVVNNFGVLDTAGPLNNSLTLNNFGQATIQATSSVAGPVVVNNIGVLNAVGPLNSSLTLNNVGQATIQATSSVAGSVVVNNIGVLNAAGPLNNSLTLNDSGQATIQSTSSVAGPVITNDAATLTANGALDSSLTVNDASIAHINAPVVGPFVANGGITNFNAPSTLAGTATINNGSVLLAAGATFNDTTTVTGGSLLANGTINAALITSGNSFLSGSGSAASLTNGGTFSPGDSGIGTFTVVGNHVNTPTGTHVNDLNAAGQTDLLAVGGTSTLQGGTLDVVAAPGNYLAGTSYTLITAAGGLSGQFANVIDNLPINYLLLYFPDRLVLRLGDAITVDGLACNARRVAEYINTFGTTFSGDILTVFTALDSLGFDDLSDALDQLQPASFQALSITSGDAAHAVNDSFMDRLNFLRITRCGQCCDPCDQGGVWISGLANYVSFDRVGCVRGFDATNGGFAIGYDKCFCDDIIAGVGAGYSNNYIKWNRHFGHSDGQNAYLGVYATKFDQDYYADVSLLGFKGTYKSKRHIEFADIDRRAKSKQCNWGINPHFGSGLILDYCGFDVIPFGEIDYYYLSQDKFREHGANSLNLHVKSNDASALRLETGVRFAKAYDCGCGQFLPYASISYVGHRYYGRKFKSSFNDQSNDFSVFGVDRCFNQAEFGLGLAYLINDQFAINASYDIDVGSKRQQQEFNFELNYRF